eukprot:m.197335 g.197335  ORF g.197335 m.197335 type:complete len:435 (+) comp20114_c0_seq1:521-1825(+)
MHITTADCSTAYLNSGLQERIYMRFPRGLRSHDEQGRELVALLHRSLYGLRQSSANWYRQLHDLLVSIGFRRARHDSCIFVKGSRTGNLTLMAVYVDDLLIACDVESTATNTISQLRQQGINITGGTDFSDFLGIHCTYDRTNSKLVLSQQKLIEELFQSDPSFQLLTRTPKLSCPLPTHMGGDVFHSGDQPAPGQADRAMQSRYRTAVGTLLYIAMKTRPDIQYAATRAATQMSNPGDKHWHALQHLMRYTWQTRSTTLNFTADTSEGAAPSVLTAYSDANWAANPETRRSISGYFFTLGSNPVLWKTKTQTVVATSSTDSETIAATLAAKSVTHARNILADMLYPQQGPTTLFVDNQAVQLASDRTQASPKLKHIEISDRYVNDLQDRNIVSVNKTDTRYNPADAFTKPLSGATFKRHLRMLQNGGFRRTDD